MEEKENYTANGRSGGGDKEQPRKKLEGKENLLFQDLFSPAV